MHGIRIVMYSIPRYGQRYSIAYLLCPADVTGPCTDVYLLIIHAPITLSVSHRMSAG